VLAGGRGRRLGGGPKGLEIVGGARIIDRVAAALRPVTRDLLLAANDPMADDWMPGLAVIRDSYKGAGGLAGVEAALRRGRDALLVAWDMPFVTTPLLNEISLAAVQQRADAVLPASHSPHGFEPFCAFYSARISGTLSRFLEDGGGAAHAFVERLDRLHILPDETVRRFGDPDQLFFSVNTPEDLARARAMAHGSE
jgi:molybdopterin-guanine dinucleotide biosynthesis protein A